MNAQEDVMAARVVGIRQEGLKPCRMVPSKREEVREARTAAMTSREKSAGCELPRWWCVLKRKEKRKASLATSGEQDSRARGWKTPLLGHRKALASGKG